MKLFISILAAGIVGVALGAAVAWESIRKADWEGVPKEEDVAVPQAAPKAVIDHDAFDFGTMEAKATGKHAFLISNRGDAPLTLKAGPTSCKCTLSKLEKTDLAPGESTNVILEWHPGDIIGHFKQSGKILSNDPLRPELVVTVSGELTTAAQVDPKEIIFSRIGMQETAHADARIWCYLPGPPLEIKSYKLSNESSAKFFDIKYEPIKRDDVNQEKNALSGVLLHVAVKPGLPQGPFQQTILVTTNRPESAQLEIPIQGVLSGDIVVAGPAWDDEQNALYMGVVKVSTGASRRLLLIVHGEHSADTKFKVVHVDPDYLHATLGETVQIGAKTQASNGPLVFQTQLMIEVPANSPLENHLGSEQGTSGIILLETTYPQVPQLKIRVRFAVEGGS